MKKDVIYIDIEDDITAIIGKVKNASSKIVALVPPKRSSVLQSLVNLKLLQKAAHSDDKRIVLITSDHSLISLAAGVKIPVARNLQSKPEVPVMDSPDIASDDTINGEELPVGELASATMPLADDSVADSISKNVDLVDTKPIKPEATANKPKSGFASKVKIPDFNKFRKKLFIFGGAGAALIIFLVWALVIAPSATVTISAKTTAVNINRTLSLSSEQSKIDQLYLKTNTQEAKRSSVVEFDATGSKEVGEKASGQVALSYSKNSSSVNIPAGTIFTGANGKKYQSNSSVTVPGASVEDGEVAPGTANVTVSALEIGQEFNTPPQAYAVQNRPNVNASGQAMTGGNKETVKVVSQADVDAAIDKLSQQDANAVKADLQKKFGSDQIIIQESYAASSSDPVSSPAVGEQAQRAKLTAETTYTMIGIARSEVKQILETVLKDAMAGKENQSIFSNGEDNIQFQEFQKLADNSYSTKLVTTGYIGTTIDAKQLASQLKGKRYGEIEQIVNSIAGVDKVDIKFSPFWVTSAPNDTNKINIKFSIVNDTN